MHTLGSPMYNTNMIEHLNYEEKHWKMNCKKCVRNGLSTLQNGPKTEL